MQCPKCNAENPEKAKFCLECGEKLSARCPQCSAELPPNAKFCLECGAKVVTPQVSISTAPVPDADVNLERLKRLIPKEYAERLLAARGKAEGERRMVTILFSDVKGSTAMGERLDPEDVMEVMNGAFEVLIGAVYRHEGTLARLMGDAILAFFGAPIAHEDDPERAVRCALEIISGAQAYAQKLEAERGIQGFNVRVGINTGLVVVGEVGSDLRVEYTAMGDAINLAARMEQNAPEGGVLISHETYLQVQGIFDIQALEPISVKGKSEPVRVYRVERAKARSFRRTAHMVAGISVPMVGRESELKQLQDALRLAQEGERQIVTVTGEPGVGKSRLLDEFENWLDLLPERLYYFKGRASAELQAMPYGLLRDLFAQRWEILESDPPETILNKLEIGLREALGAGETIPMKAQFIGALLGYGLSSPQLDALKDEAQQVRDRGLMYLIEYFRAASALRLVVILLEDLHWADDSSLDAVQRLGLSTEGQHLLIVGLTRPGLLERRPRWGEGQSYHTRLELHPLSRLGSRQLVTEILRKVEQVPVSLRELVTSVAEGNPLYVEELVKMLIEERVIIIPLWTAVDPEPRWQVDEARLAGLQVPPTLMGVLQSRLDGLPADERAALQCAAVVGRVFWDQALHYILKKEDEQSAQLEQTLAALRRHELVFHRESSTFADVQEYIFKHAVLREVAYESLLKRVRRSYHLQVAEWLIEVNGERAAEYAGLIGEHLELAEEKERAFGYLKQAAQGAAARYANTEAVSYYTRALALLPASERETRWELLLGREKVLALLARREAQRQDLDELEQLAAELQDPLRQAQTALHKMDYFAQIGQLPEAIDTAQTVIHFAQIAGELFLQARAHGKWGGVLQRLGDYPAARQQYEIALGLAQRVDTSQARKIEATLLLYLYWVTPNSEPNLEKEREQVEQILRLCREAGDRSGEAAMLNELGCFSREHADFARAQEYLEQSLRICREIGDRSFEGYPLRNLGTVFINIGDYLHAQACFEQLLSSSREIGEPFGESVALWDLGHLSSQIGQYTRAQQALEQSLSILDQTGDVWYQGAVHEELFWYYLSLGEYSLANTHLEKSENFFQKVDTKGDWERIFARGWMCLYQNDLQGARAHFERELSNYEKKQVSDFAAETCISLGYVWIRSGDPLKAQEAFQKRKLLKNLELPHLLAEVQAGLARTALEQGDPIQAQATLAAALTFLDNGGEVMAMVCPELAHLNYYHVLKACDPPRAGQILQAAYQRLQTRSATIPNDELRQSYWQNVPWNREIAALWEAREQKAG